MSAAARFVAPGFSMVDKTRSFQFNKPVVVVTALVVVFFWIPVVAVAWVLGTG